MLSLQIDQQQLRQLIETVVAVALVRMEADREASAGKVAYTEAEAAEQLGLKERQLQDERHRGRIQSSKIVGSRIRYQRSDLIDYMIQRRVELNVQ